MDRLQPAGITQAPVFGQLDWNIAKAVSGGGFLGCSEAGSGCRAELLLPGVELIFLAILPWDIIFAGEGNQQPIEVPVVAHRRGLELTCCDLPPLLRPSLEHVQLHLDLPLGRSFYLSIQLRLLALELVDLLLSGIQSARSGLP